MRIMALELWQVQECGVEYEAETGFPSHRNLVFRQNHRHVV